MGDKVEITEDDAARVIRNHSETIDNLNALIKKSHKVVDLDHWGDGAGFVVEGQDLKKEFSDRGKTHIKVYEDAREAVRADMAADLARIHAIYGADFDSKIDIDKVNAQINGTDN